MDKTDEAQINENSETAGPSNPNAQLLITDNIQRSKFENQRLQFHSELRNRQELWILPIRLNQLREWANQEPDLLMLEVLPRLKDFHKLFEFNISRDMMVLVLKILGKLCSSSFINQNKTEFINLVSKDEFIAKLENYILVQLPLSKQYQLLFTKEIDEFVENLVIVFELLIEMIPTKVCQILPKVIESIRCTNSLLKTQQRLELSLHAKDKLMGLKEKIEIIKVKQQQELPNDFREMSVYPTITEITVSERGFLQRHKISGAYDSVEQYLDVQFRLLREDFIAPLRKGIQEYLHRDSQFVRKFANIRIHPHVEFLSPHYTRGQTGVLVQFEFDKRNLQGFRFYKRFMYGSLVCFTNDNFSTLLFGKVIERDQGLLERGRIVVSFDSEYANYKFNVPYLMVEYGVYFEPYYHVLKALQNMQEERFPMKEYFIDVKTEIELPDYLNNNSIYMMEEFYISLSDPHSWPSANQFGFDDTQYKAFKAALTQKFMVIQGPPGTGKTFLGLQIAKALINNRMWYYGKPILVVCYTNHALDQFLEGLIDITTKIVRVGGQSKSGKLKNFNLRYRRRYDREGRNSILNVYQRLLYDKLDCIRGLSKKLDEIRKFNGVINFRHFMSVDPDFCVSWFRNASDEEILEWLLFDAGFQITKQRDTYQLPFEKVLTEEKGEPLKRVVEKELDKLLETNIRSGYGGFDEFEDIMESIPIRFNLASYYLTTVSQMEARVFNTSCQLKQLDEEEETVSNVKWELEYKLENQKDELDYLQMRLHEGRSMKVTNKPTDIDLMDPHNMSPNSRWSLYFYWLLKYQESLLDRLVELQNEYHDIYSQYTKIRDSEDTQIMQHMTVIGMTTTSAARLQTVLQALQCPIVIVEEAAEVLESHIVVSLSQHCQHLILIGDHQQLRPSTADYNIEKDYNLGISLFERMVLNNVQCYVLGVQHRMRPEIAQLIVPSIYPKLENHKSVYNFPKILGIDANLYFIHHDHPEKESGDSSKMNTHEAQFLLRLANYLVQNGYEPEEITVVAAYSAQMFALCAERKLYPLLDDVNITVLDNYQGEESRIILLSLVRNNQYNSIGFLKIENRVCVALSRAREGLYVMGNMDLLCRNSELWRKIKMTLESQNSLGKNLLLRCQIHPEETTRVKVPEDFDKVPEGGCRKMCKALLKCEHTCPRVCHVQDRKHENTRCMVDCSKTVCENNHECNKRCYEECGKCTILMEKTLPCGHTHMIPCSVDVSKCRCRVPVEASLPCGHNVQDKPCCESIETYLCTFPCGTRLESCGHTCSKNCHIKDDPNHLKYKCYKPCLKANVDCSMPEGEKHPCKKWCSEECSSCCVLVKKVRTVCSHYSDVACSVDANTVECQKPCKKLLRCGHICRKKCYESCENCQEMIEKAHPKCGHPILTKCCEEPDRNNCNKSCPLKLPCGHTCKNKCNQLCTKECKTMVDYSKPTACGHKFKVNCYLVQKDLPSYSYELLKFCMEPCKTELPCKHVCSGTCGKCVQGRIHQACQERCEARLICGHKCPLLCHEICQPCTQPCSYRCRHNTCKKPCGEPCIKCIRTCLRKCKHVECTAKCWEICTVPPCSEPCQKKIKCGHPCVGFCGDPCPPLCSICNKQKVLEIFPSFDDKRNTRFVLLNECKHIVESQEMEDWLKQSEEIKYKSCPKCGVHLTGTHRYSDYIKRNLTDIKEIKKQFFEHYKESETRQRERELFNKLYKVRSNATTLLEFYSPNVKRLLEVLKRSLQAASGRTQQQPLNKLSGKVNEIKINMLDILVDIFNRAKLNHCHTIEKAVRHIDFLCFLILKQGVMLSNQEVVDFQNEIKRLQRIMHFYQIKDLVSPCLSSKSLEIKKAHDDALSLLFQPGKYTNEIDIELRDKLTKLHDGVASKVEIVDVEDIEIVQIMGMGKSHWFKCLKQHYYGTNDLPLLEHVNKCAKCLI